MLLKIRVSSGDDDPLTSGEPSIWNEARSYLLHHPGLIYVGRLGVEAGALVTHHAPT